MPALFFLSLCILYQRTDKTKWPLGLDSVCIPPNHKTIQLYAAMWSLNFRPLVSRGKYETAMPETSITVMNIRMAAVWWHACTRPTATRGHKIPPKRAIELAKPTPVALTAVG